MWRRERSLHYDLRGRPISQAEWVALGVAGKVPVQVGLAVLRDQARRHRVVVSTAWFGLDMSYVPGSVPLPAETMVFGDVPELDCRGVRYPSIRTARAGHEQVVRLLRARGWTVRRVELAAHRRIVAALARRARRAARRRRAALR